MRREAQLDVDRLYQNLPEPWTREAAAGRGPLTRASGAA
jgi:hypothetical protein